MEHFLLQRRGLRTQDPGGEEKETGVSFHFSFFTTSIVFCWRPGGRPGPQSPIKSAPLRRNLYKKSLTRMEDAQLRSNSST